MLSAFANCLKIPDLRQRIFFTLALTFVCRLIDVVPTPGVNVAALQALIKESEQRGGGFLSWIDLFSGGALGNFAVGALAIWPYISASIILQMMTAIIPALGRLAREGDVGRQKLSQYTRYFTVIICLVQGYFLAANIERPEVLGISTPLVAHPGWAFRLTTVLVMTTGTMVLMWLGEQITERGIGNGISIVITVNIISRLPSAIYTAWNMFRNVEGVESRFGIFHLVGLLVLIFVVTAATIALTQGHRKIPIHRPQRVIGRKIAMGQSSYMPLRVNYSGVMPIIFAGAMIQFPVAILRSVKGSTICQEIAAVLGREGWLYILIYGGMILFFSYFWVATQFNPLQIADDLKKNGAYVPGIRPGRPTAEFLDKTMVRITLFGALFLTVIAVIPTLLSGHLRIPWIVSQFFGGTSLLIVVGVALDTMRQVESHLLMRHYDGFLRKGKLHGRR